MGNRWLLVVSFAVAGCFRDVHPRSVADCQRGGWPRYFVQAGIQADFGESLCVMGEGPLASAPADEAYRFLWLRSFHDQVVVRVERSEGGATLTALQLAGPIGHGDGSIVRYEKRKLGTDEWTALTRAIDAAGFGDLPPDDGIQGLDGAAWVLEGKRGASHHVVARWEPKPEFRAACLAFLEAARFTFPASDVY